MTPKPRRSEERSFSFLHVVAVVAVLAFTNRTFFLEENVTVRDLIFLRFPGHWTAVYGEM